MSRDPAAAARRRGTGPVLGAAALNRATLARQRLLDPADLDPVELVEAVGGFQAQEPASPFIAAWTRSLRLDRGDLDSAFRDRRLVKATLMRATLHAVSRTDYRRLRPAMEPVLTALTRRQRLRPDDPRLAALREAALAHAARPRSNTELRDHVARLEPEHPAEDLWWWIRRHAPLVHAPTDEPWTFGRRPALVAADAWLAGDAFATEAEGAVHLVRRYLGAFGPATAADAGAWSGLPVSRLRPAIAAIEAAGELRRFADERGRELVDLAGAPLPDPRTPAPPRLLPMWDGVLLAHADRTRVVSDADRALVVATNGDTFPTFLADGTVGGLWWAEAEPGGRTRIELEPFRPLSDGVRRALEDEAERLAAFVEPAEPRVYARYRSSRARRGR